MEKQMLDNKISKIKKGVYTKATWQSFPLKNKSQVEYSHRIKKVSSGIIRLGLDYENLSSMVGKEVSPRANHKWIEKNYVTAVVNENDMVQYCKVRLYTSKSPKHHTTSKWYFDDNEVSKEWLLENGYITKSQYNSTKGDIPFFEVPIENLISLG